ncbi:MAG: sensor histidine kinase [Actinomycetota bacterium]
MRAYLVTPSRALVLYEEGHLLQHAGEMASMQFLELASHELRTPLTALRGTIRLLIERGRELPQETADAMLEVLDRSAARLESTILDLLAASEFDASYVHETTMKTEAVSVLDIVSQCTRALPVNGHHVTFAHDGVDLRVRVQPEHLREIVDRVLDNAVKFTKHDGQIDVHVGKFDNYAIISITDDGPGIPPQEHERIFERFVTLGDLLTRESNGLGMGLFIVRNLVESMDGAVWVKSEPGHGATFRVKLPLA